MDIPNYGAEWNIQSQSSYNVNQVVKLFQSRNLVAQRKFIATCPDSPMRDTALKLINHNTILISLSLLASDYSRGINCQLGIIIGEACYQLSQQVFDLLAAKNGAVSCIVVWESLGKHNKLISFTSDAINWFESQEYYEAIPTLLISQINSYIELGKYDQAQVLLAQTNWKKLLTKDHFSDIEKKHSIEQKLINRIKQSTILPSQKPEVKIYQLETSKAHLGSTSFHVHRDYKTLNKCCLLYTSDAADD